MKAARVVQDGFWGNRSAGTLHETRISSTGCPRPRTARSYRSKGQIPLFFSLCLDSNVLIQYAAVAVNVEGSVWDFGVWDYGVRDCQHRRWAVVPHLQCTIHALTPITGFQHTRTMSVPGDFFAVGHPLVADAVLQIATQLPPLFVGVVHPPTDRDANARGILIF